ncbi:family 20 glycosylhydrolase [Cyclobacterium sp.]|uniref:family 20 glycosylhydrolase n=1 Tax=Cyclobacterium sp. TaxID=1966343 RepID=UPI0019B5D09F|nr:family 20 glycosylhydrolase [Cyclobacterium sp.]MBD3627542.1 carbohydate-binding domain-containing protein [Cyclobacterium sp.]
MNKRNTYFLFLSIIIFFNSCQQETSWQNRVEQLHLEWELVSNFVEEEGQFEARFIMENKGGDALRDEGWALFFNMSPRRIVSSTQADITHINGDWYKLSPRDGFYLGAGEQLEINYTGIEGVIKETDAPMGLYMVFYGQEDQELATIPVSNWEVRPFERKEQLLRGAMDEEIPYSPASQFEANDKREPLISSELLPIIPSPYQLEKRDGVFEIEAGMTIAYQEGLENEAGYLNEKLESLTGVNLGSNAANGANAAIYLSLSDIRVDGKQKEAYRLEIDGEGISITGGDAAGVFYGVQSLLALMGPEVYLSDTSAVEVPFIYIEDVPRFGFRSLHVDVARNFQTKETIKKALDMMAHYKLNHFLFYTSEDEGWRVEIPGLPELTTVGAQRQHVAGMDAAALHPGYGSGPEAYGKGSHGSGFYTREEFIDILKYARDRHITIIPELNFPGHARAAIKSMEARYLKFMEAGDEVAAEEYRLIDPADQSEYLSAQAYKDNVVSVVRESTYRFYEKVVDELAAMYADAGLEMKKMHAGGDEVPVGSWTQSPMVEELLEESPGDSPNAELLLDELPVIGDMDNLQAFFFRELLKRLEKRDLEVHVWEEMALKRDETGTLRPNPEFVGRKVIPYIWNNMFDYPDLGYQLANQGYEVVLCNVSNFYFDLAYSNDPAEPGLYWAGFVNTKNAWAFAPFDWFKTTYKSGMGKLLDREEDFKDMVRINPEAKDNIIGLEAQLWGETVKGGDMAEYYIFPKLLGFAESAWARARNWEQEEDLAIMDREIEKGWNRFAGTIAAREYPKLAHWNGGYAYRIAPPGVKIIDGKLHANTNFPGLEIRYTTDNSEPDENSNLYQGPIEMEGPVKIRAIDLAGRASRTLMVRP